MKREAPEPGGEDCRWCDTKRELRGGVLRCPHCDSPHPQAGCLLCEVSSQRTDNRSSR